MNQLDDDGDEKEEEEEEEGEKEEEKGELFGTSKTRRSGWPLTPDLPVKVEE